jgi:hypothetical protein
LDHPIIWRAGHLDLHFDLPLGLTELERVMSKAKSQSNRLIPALFSIMLFSSVSFASSPGAISRLKSGAYATSANYCGLFVDTDSDRLQITFTPTANLMTRKNCDVPGDAMTATCPDKSGKGCVYGDSSISILSNGQISWQRSDGIKIYFQYVCSIADFNSLLLSEIPNPPESSPGANYACFPNAQLGLPPTCYWNGPVYDDGNGGTPFYVPGRAY